MPIHVANPGFITTVQDLGRYGYAHLGISPAGAADNLSFQVANLLAGNDVNAPALEMTMLGATLEFDEPAIVAVAGAACEVVLDGGKVPERSALDVRAGAVLHCGPMLGGPRAYVAVQGGIKVPRVMGSASTNLGGGFGGHEGRLLRRGDVLAIAQHHGLKPRRLREDVDVAAALAQDQPLRVTRSAQADWFSAGPFRTLLSSTYVVSEQSGRTGLRLKGPQILPTMTTELLTDGVPLGAIQIPQDAQPIILFVDQQTTGGYPKIASVIAADMHRVGQLKAGDEVRFAEVSIANAIQLLRELQQWLNDIFVSDNL